MKNLLLLFVVSFFFFWFTFSVNASEQLPKNINAYNKYLSNVDTDERVVTYSEMIDNIDTLIKEVNASKTISKLQKRKLLAQYRLYKSRTQFALKREQKRAIVNIDFQKIISKKNTNSGIIISTNTGHTNNIITYQQPRQQYQQNTPNNTNISPSVNNTTNPIITNNNNNNNNNNSSQSGNTIWNPPIAPIQKNSTVTFSSPWPKNYFIAWNSSANLGDFSIQTWDDNLIIRKLVFRNVWTAKLRDLVIGTTKIWNFEQQQVVNATTIIQDNTINLVGMALDIKKNKKLSFTIQANIGAILWSLWKTVQLTFIPEESEIHMGDQVSASTLLWSGNLINTLLFPVVWVYWSAPYVNMNRKTPTTTLINFENWSSEFDIEIESFKLDILSSQYWNKLNGMVCFRPEQSTISCKDSWAFMPRVIEDNSSTYYLQVTPATFSSSNTVSKKYGNNNKAQYELYLDGEYLDEAPRIIVSEIVYKTWWYTFKVSANSAGNLENPILIN